MTERQFVQKRTPPNYATLPIKVEPESTKVLPSVEAPYNMFMIPYSLK